MILLFWLKRENDFTILVGREYDFTVDSSSGAKRMLKIEPYLVLSSKEQVKAEFRYVFGRVDKYMPHKTVYMRVLDGIAGDYYLLFGFLQRIFNKVHTHKL